jgi:hypothetical protein
MDLRLMLLGLVAFALVLLVMRVLMQAVNERAAMTHQKPKRIIPVPDGTITRLSHG